MQCSKVRIISCGNFSYRTTDRLIMKSNEFIEYIKDILAPFGQITTRAMFGSYGIYKDGVIIGIVARNELLPYLTS